MSEVLFYRLERTVLEDVLPSLLERTCERGWHAVVRVGSAERMQALDRHLWTYSDQSFLPHGTADMGHAARQPIYLTAGDENPNAAQVLFLAGAAMPPDWSAPQLRGFSRIVLLFDGRDPGALSAAETARRSAREAGHDVTFWKQSESGKWEKQD